MRRRLAILGSWGLCLLAGAAINVLVAWGFALWDGMVYERIEHDPGEAMILMSGYRAPADWNIRTLVEQRGLGTHNVMITEMVWAGSTLAAMEGSRNRSVVVYEHGWPMRSLRVRGAHDSRATGDGLVRLWRSGIVLNDGSGNAYPVVLPVRPMPIGFAANTLLLGGVVWLVGVVGVGPFALRRVHRRRGGRCEACGYDLDGLDTCPECGSDA